MISVADKCSLVWLYIISNVAVKIWGLLMPWVANLARYDWTHSDIILLYEEINDLARSPVLDGNGSHAWWIISTPLQLWNIEQ